MPVGIHTITLAPGASPEEFERFMAEELLPVARTVITQRAALITFSQTLIRSRSDGAGNQVTLDDFRGEVVVLNLWATWCAPCRHEMPSLDRLQARFGGNGLEVIAQTTNGGTLDDQVRLRLEALSPYLTIISGPVNLGLVGAFCTVATDHELVEQDWLRATEDFKEGIASTAERRTPRFLGR